MGLVLPEHLQEKVKEVGAAIGLAFDGDSDRLIALLMKWERSVDGDKISVHHRSYLSSKRSARKNTTSQPSCPISALHKALDAKGIQKEITAVGDRYVVEEMRKSGYNLVEQSGHVVIMITMQLVMVN